MKNSALKKIYREGIDESPLYGIILDESNDYILLAREYDFHVDGFSILRKSDITHCVSNKSTQYCFRILKSEKLIASIQIPKVNLESWQSIFRSLGVGTFISAENGIEEDYWIGPIVRVNKKSIVLHYFNGTGEWVANDKISYTDITSVEFDTNYINMHEKHIKA